MSLISGVLGNVSEITPDKVAGDLAPILVEGEHLNRCFKLIRDLIIFTDRRLILVDKQGMTGKKTEYHTIPYKSITHFSVETAGRFDLDAELKIYLSGKHAPIQKRFKKGSSILEVQRALAATVAK